MARVGAMRAGGGGGGRSRGVWEPGVRGSCSVQAVGLSMQPPRKLMTFGWESHAGLGAP